MASVTVRQAGMHMADSTVVDRDPQSLDHEVLELERSPLRGDTPRMASRPATPPPPRQPSGTAAVIDRTLSTASNLVKLHPTGTVLAFQSLTPSFSNHGVCYTSNAYLIAVLIILCSLSCIFFSFTDSLVGRDGKLYYGVATWTGFYVINYDGAKEDQDKVLKELCRLRIRPLDYVHAFFSSLVFLTVAFSDANVQSCFFSGARVNAKELLINLPLGAGFLSSMVFIIFPTSRKGIGYSDMTPNSH